MSIINLISILLTLTAAFSYLNYKYLKLPPTIGIMLSSLIFSIVFIVIAQIWPESLVLVREAVKQIDFEEVLMNGMLAFLLFAGALHVDLNLLSSRKWEIACFATFGVIFSTFFIGTGMYYILDYIFNFQAKYIHCLLFGALISPTDPIAVLGILKQAKAPKSLEIKITGESLFNDGIGVVVFLSLAGIASSGGDVSFAEVATLFGKEAIGGVIFGLLIGGLAYKLLKDVDNYQVEVLITLALVAGGYSLAHYLHTSGPIAIVVAGLLIGNHGRRFAMSAKTREHLDTFWELIDEILNAVLFVLIGLEVLVLDLSWKWIFAGIIAIPLILFVRFVSLGIPVSLFRLKKVFTEHAIKIMTWGGLRGGISIALAFSLPIKENDPTRSLFLTVTYIVVIFSILVQGLTLKKLITKKLG